LPRGNNDGNAYNEINRMNILNLGRSNRINIGRRLDVPDFIIFEQPESNLRFLLGFILGCFMGLYALIILNCCRLRPKFKSGLRCGMIIGTFIFCVYSLMQPNSILNQ
jgi:hypothetical protein